MVAKSILGSAGVECFLTDDNLIRMYWLYSNLVGGIKLLVRHEDVEGANKLLDQSTPEKLMLKVSANTSSRNVRSAARWT
jgi:hypothetical protein